MTFLLHQHKLLLFIFSLDNAYSAFQCHYMWFLRSSKKNLKTNLKENL